MFIPFGFMAGAVEAGRTDIPPYDPFVYYDATNTTYSAEDEAEDVVSLGATSEHNMGAGTGNVLYTSGDYWDFDSTDSLQLDSSATTSEFLNAMGKREHTIISLINPDSATEEDIVSNGATTGAVLMMLFEGNKIRGHAFSGTTIVTDLSLTITTGNWMIAAQRLENTTGTTGELTVFGGEPGSITSTSTTGTYSGTGSGPGLLNLGTRGGRGYFTGKMGQVAIYDKALTDAEVQGAYEYMIARQGL